MSISFNITKYWALIIRQPLLCFYTVVSVLSFCINSWIFYIPFLIVSWWLIAKSFKRSFFTSILSGLVFGFAVSLSAITTFSALIWIIGNPLSLTQIGVVSNILLICFALFINKSGPIFPQRFNNVFDFQDIGAVLVVVSFMGLYSYSSILANGKLALKLEAVQSVTKAYDDQNHFTMFREVTGTNKGILLGNNTIYKPDTLPAVYPKGAHVAAAVIAEPLQSIPGSKGRNTPGTIDELYIYSALKLLFYITSVFILVRFSTELANKLLADKLTNHAKVIATLISVMSGLYIVVVYSLPLYADGAFSFLPVFLLTPIFLLALADITLDKKQISMIALLGLITATAMLSWTIAGIPLLILAFFATARNLIQNSDFHSRLIVASTFALTSIAGLVQIFIQLTVKVDILSVNTPGGFYTFPLLLPLVVSIFFLYGSSRAVGNSLHGDIIARAGINLMSLLLFICAVISVINFKKYGEVQYYFTKFLYLPLILVAFLAIGVGIYLVVSGLDKKIARINSVSYVESVANTTALLVFVFSILFISFPPNLMVVDYILKGYRVVGTSNATTLNKILSDIKKDNEVARFILSDDTPYNDNVMTSNALNISSDSNACQGVIFEEMIKTKTIKAFNDKTIAKCIGYGAKNIQIYTSSDIFNTLPSTYSGKINIQIIQL